MSKSKELLKNTVIIFLGKVSTQFLAFFLLPLYTSYLDSGAYGKIDLLLTYITLVVPIVTLEIEMGTFRALIDNRKDKRKVNDIVYNSFSLIIKFSSVVAMAFGIITIFLKFEYCYLFALCVIVMIFSNLLMQIARGLGKNIYYSISSFIIGSINILVNIILIIFLHKGAESILVASSVSNFIGIVYLSAILKVPNMIRCGSKDKKIKKKLLLFSWPLVPNTISWWMINASDRTIVSFMLGASANGIYAVSTKFSSIISSLLNIFNLSWTESASIHINDEDRDEFFSNINDTILRLFSALCIDIIAFMPIIFPIFINKNYIEAYKYIPINIIAMFFSCIVSIYSAIYVAKKLTKKVASTSFISALINIVVDLILIKYIGIFAAAISTAVAYIIMAIYRSIDLRKYVKIKYNLKNLITIFIGFSVVTFLYYQDGKLIKYINFFIAIIYSIFVNFDFIKKGKEVLASKLIKTSKES